MKPGTFLGGREDPVITLICQECKETVFTKGTMTFDNVLGQSVLEIEEPDHEHRINFSRRVVGNLRVSQ